MDGNTVRIGRHDTVSYWQKYYFVMKYFLKEYYVTIND